MEDMLKYENYYYDMGCINICGVDEAGRGPLAGPVCAAAVILPRGLVIEQVNDSKKLTEKKREMLFDIIKEKAAAYNIAWASVEEIESMNILNATMLAMKRAVEGLPVKAGFALIDGDKRPRLDIPCVDVVKGDSLSESIAAASILAKVSRDRLMVALAEKLLDETAVPRTSFDDALHISAAAIGGMDFLLSWNCRHIANPEARPIIRRVCEEMGYRYPEICTPFEMLGGMP